MSVVDDTFGRSTAQNSQPWFVGSASTSSHVTGKPPPPRSAPMPTSSFVIPVSSTTPDVALEGSLLGDDVVIEVSVAAAVIDIDASSSRMSPEQATSATTATMQ